MELINAIFVLKQEVLCVKKKKKPGKDFGCRSKIRARCEKKRPRLVFSFSHGPFFLWMGKEVALFCRSVKAMSRLREQRGTMGMLWLGINK